MFNIKLLSTGFETLSLFSQPRPTRSIIRLPFFVARPGRYKTCFFFCLPAPACSKKRLSFAGPVFGKIISDIPARAGPLQSSNTNALLH